MKWNVCWVDCVNKIRTYFSMEGTRVLFVNVTLTFIHMTLTLELDHLVILKIGFICAKNEVSRSRHWKVWALTLTYYRAKPVKAWCPCPSHWLFRYFNTTRLLVQSFLCWIAYRPSCVITIPTWPWSEVSAVKVGACCGPATETMRQREYVNVVSWFGRWCRRRFCVVAAIILCH